MHAYNEYKETMYNPTSGVDDSTNSKTPEYIVGKETKQTPEMEALPDHITFEDYLEQLGLTDSNTQYSDDESTPVDDFARVTLDESSKIQSTSPVDYSTDSKTPNYIGNGTQQTPSYASDGSVKDPTLSIENTDALVKPTIYISIAEHQPYFKGGDGDFIDCIQHAINDLGYNCIRIIEKFPDNFPTITTANNIETKIDISKAQDEIDKINAKIHLGSASNVELENLHLMEQIIAKKIIVLDEYQPPQSDEEATSDEYQTPRSDGVATITALAIQNKLSDILKKQHTQPNPPCVLCIGSRMYRNEENMLVDSGSLFSGNFLKTIKSPLFGLSNNIKVIIFPLEHKFFIRKINTLEHLQCQLEEHLLYADSIHFLNDHDLSYFKKHHRSLKLFDCPDDRLSQQKTLWPHKHLIASTKEIIPIVIQNNKITDEQLLAMRNIPTCMISGIYTTAQLTCDDLDKIPTEITTKLKNYIATINRPVNIKKTHHIYQLCQRPKKILWFGMVRPNKGLDSAEKILDLIVKLKRIGYSFVIAGSFNIDNSIFIKLMKNTITRYFNLKSNNKGRIRQNKKTIDEIGILKTTPIPNTSNEIASLIYNDLRKKYPSAFDYEIYFGPTPQELKCIALNCRYALKLDNKGMANNASSIVSTLGLFLPTITSVGMLTGNDFRGSNHKITGTTIHNGRYKNTILTGPKQYKSAGFITKVEPVSLTHDEICTLLSSETDDSYRIRIEELYELNKPQQTQGELSMFHPKTAATKIIDDIQRLTAMPPLKLQHQI